MAMSISRKEIFVILLISSTCLAPLVNVATLPFEKGLNLGFEDIILVLAVLTWLPLSLRGSRLKNILLLYYFSALFSTLLGITMGWLGLLRALFFLGKEVEYLILFMLIRKIAWDEKTLRVALTTFLVCALINISYMIFQLGTGQIGKIPGDFSPYRVQYYGIRILASYVPTVVGNYYNFVIIVALSIGIYIPFSKQKFLSIACFGSGIIGLIASFSRSAIFGGSIALTVCVILLLFTRMKFKVKFMTIILFIILFVAILGSFNYLKYKTDTVLRVTRMGSFIDWRSGVYYQPKNAFEFISNLASQYWFERYEVDNIFGPIFELIQLNPIFGFGKSALGTTIEDIETFGEAHNYFLRILAEMGMVGLFVFVYLLLKIFKISFYMFKHGYSETDKIIALINIGNILFLTLSSIAQDALVNVKTATLFWIFLGLMDGRIKWINMSLSSSHAAMKNRLSRNV